MQNGARQQSFLPDRSMTYSTASSIYGRESAYDFPAPVVQTSSAPLASPARTIPEVQFPSPEILLGNYGAKSSVPSQAKRRRPSLNDPIQTHLLLQTALGDSGEYEILSFEEVEALKRDTQSIRARITGLQKKLALETKVRDAAKSLVRLRSAPSSTTSSPRLHRRSSNSTRDPQDRAQAEYAEAMRKCDALARELYHLEQRERQVQTKILQHTAGILQNTHHGFSKNQGMPFVPDGRPDSPASLDGTHSRAMNGGMQSYEGLLFNEVPSYDGMLEGLGMNSHKRQLSSRMSNDQREMMMYLAGGLEDLNRRIAGVLARTNATKGHQYNSFPEMVDEAVNISFAQRLDRLNQGLDDIEQEQTSLLQMSAKKTGEDVDVAAQLQNQLAAGAEQVSQLKAELQAIQQQNAELQREQQKDRQQASQLQAELQASVQENLALQQEYDRVEDSMTSQLGDMNTDLYALLSTAAPNIPKVPSEPGPMDSLEYTKARIANVRSLVQSSSAAINESRQIDAVLQGLWAFILGAEEELRTRKRAEQEQIAAKRSEGAQIDSEDEVSPDEDDGLGEDFSVQAFNTKVQWLVSQSLYLKEKQSSLRRKVKAHRERADRGMDNMAGNDDLKMQLDKANSLYATAKGDLEELQVRAVQLQKAHEEKDVRIKALQEDIGKVEHEARNEAQQEAQVEVAVLEQQLRDAQQRYSSLEKDLAAVQQLREVEDKARLAREEQDEKTTAELANLSDEVIRLKTELTIAQAELEGAYGSRSQRAAELERAANSEASKKLDEVTARNTQLEAQVANLQKGSGDKETELRKELAETLKEFEELTKASVDQEREREELESSIDKYRDRIEGLEAQIAEDQVKWLGLVGDGGTASPGSTMSAPAQSMSVVVLKNEFKKMMREARTESAKQLRAEQDARRKVESELRNLRKNSSTGK